MASDCRYSRHVKYNIISLNDDRKVYKDYIRANTSLEEIYVPAVDGRSVDIREELNKRDLFTTGWLPKQGEAGVWLSNYDNWLAASEMDEPLIVFEDDAIIEKEFDDKLNALIEELTVPWDYVALWVPENQIQDYVYNIYFDPKGDPVRIGDNLPYALSHFKNTRRTARVYQGYGMVSLMYSPEGGKRLLDLAHERGMYTPVDCFVYQQAHMGNVKGFAPTPIFANIVRYDWKAPSHVQQTERIDF
jgi:GR25 family glycosyltransferase involved in LPS biosynthesis